MQENGFPQTLLRIMINALSIVAAVKIVDGLEFQGEWWKMIMVGAVFGVINAVIKPIFMIFTFPLLILTLGLFTFITNGLMLAITASLSDFLGLGLKISGFWPAVKGALIISLVSMVLSWLTGVNRLHIHYHNFKDDES